MSPPPILGGLCVIAHAEADDDVVFEQRNTLNVDGIWLGRVARLAICQEFDTKKIAVQHCSEAWEPLGIAGGYESVDAAKAAVERSYHGIGTKWADAEETFEAAHDMYRAQLKASACSFCGRPPLEVRTMIGDDVRICGQCVDEFYAAIHEETDGLKP